MPFPSDLLFFASYDSSTTADYSKNGNPTPTSVRDSPSINTSDKQCGAGCLELDGANYPVALEYTESDDPQSPMGNQGSVVFYHYTASTLAAADVLYLVIGALSYEVVAISCNPSAPNLIFDLYDGAGNFIVGLVYAAPPVDTWYHVECNYDLDAGNIRMFIDGTLVESDTFAPTTMGPGNAGYDIGHRTRNSGLHRIDDLQIWNTVQHTANFTPACVSFIAAYQPLITFGYPFGFPSKRGLGR